MVYDKILTKETRMKLSWLGIGFVAAALVGLAPLVAQDKAKAKGPRTLGTEDGLTFCQTRCMNCHGNPNVPTATSLAAIRLMSPEQIYASLTTGKIEMGLRISYRSFRL